MISHESMRYAMRAYAKTLVVCSTGAITMSATATGYSRTVGSFLTDRLATGMELSASGFAKSGNNGAKMITAISEDGKLVSVLGGLTAEAAAAGRTLSVGFPSTRAWENKDFTPPDGTTYFDERYIAGPPPAQVTVGPKGEVELKPMYQLMVNVPSDTGEVALTRYIDALSTLFAPRTPLVLGNGDILRVRADTGPYPGAIQPGQPGFSVLPITFPFWIRTFNSF